jgi:hypothetical protein
MNGELYELGPNGGAFIGHKKDGKNYFAGQQFKLDHLEPDAIKAMVKAGQVVKVKKADAKEAK